MSRDRAWLVRRGGRWPWLAGLLLQLSVSSAQEIDARVRAALDLGGDAWIGQQVVLKIELLTNGLSFSGQRIHLPDVPGALVLEDAVSTVKLSEGVDGKTWQVLSYRYPMFAQRAGRIELAPAAVAFSVSAGYGSEPEHFDLQTRPLAFNVRSPPGVTDPAGLATTTDFSLKVVVTPDPADRKVGDALTRTVTRTAAGVSGMAFAPLPMPDIPGVTAYPKTPAVDDRSHRGDLTGTRVESVSYVLQQAGELTIPGIELQWWDPVAERLNTESVPALVLEVAVNPALSPSFDPLEALDFAANHPWALLAAVAAIAAVMWAAFRSLPSGLRRLRRWREARRLSEAARFKGLLRACRSNEPVPIYNAYVLWISGEGGPDPTLLRVEVLAGELEHLQTALVGRAPDWRADAFLRALHAVRHAASQAIRETQPGSLPALNPYANDLDFFGSFSLCSRAR